MASISQNHVSEYATYSIVQSFLHTFKIPTILKSVGAYKSKGVPVALVFQKLFSLVFVHRTMFMEYGSQASAAIGKDTFYRFVNSCNINWMKFTTMLSALIVNDRLLKLTGDDRANVFIVDDTTYERNRSKKVELLSWVRDHSKNVTVRGFRLLTLGFSDGNTFMPVNSCLLSSRNQKTLIQESFDMDKRTCGYRQRQLAQTKAPEVMLTMIRTALKNGLRAQYVLFDSWFSSPSSILAIKEEGLDVIAMVKKTPKVHYLYKGEMLPAEKIYRMNKKRRGRSKYQLSVGVEVCSQEREKSIPARLVFVRNRNKPKEYLVLICTDESISEEDIIRIYGKRWGIEVFFKACKSFLRLTKECRSISYDAMTAYVAIVFARYMLLALENRQQRDNRTFGQLFYAVCDELPDITLTESLQLLMASFAKFLLDKLFLSEEELSLMLEEFLSTIPETLKSSLQKNSQREKIAC